MLCHSWFEAHELSYHTQNLVKIIDLLSIGKIKPDHVRYSDFAISNYMFLVRPLSKLSKNISFMLLDCMIQFFFIYVRVTFLFIFLFLIVRHKKRNN